MSFDELYRKSKNAFGENPEHILVEYDRLMSRRRPVLDIGAGQGRHALFLARRGFAVDAIDPSRVAIEALSTEAEAPGLAVRCRQCGFKDWAPETDFYSGILLFGLIQILSWEDIHSLLEKIDEWTCEGSLVYVTAFTTGDPSLARFLESSNGVGKNSYADQEGRLRTFLEPGEILDLFSTWKVIHHWEGLGPEHRHGDGPLQRHALAEAVFQRQ